MLTAVMGITALLMVLLFSVTGTLITISIVTTPLQTIKCGAL